MPITQVDLSKPFAEYKGPDGVGSAYDQAHASLTASTAAQSKLIAHLGGRRRRTRRKKQGGGAGGVAFNVPHNVAEAPGTAHPYAGTLGKLMEVGSQHAANSIGDKAVHDAPVVVGGRKKRRGKKTIRKHKRKVGGKRKRTHRKNRK